MQTPEEKLERPASLEYQSYDAELNQDKSLHVPIPWITYRYAYYAQAIIMSMLLMNVPVFLRQALTLDWVVLATSFIAIYSPVLFRPIFAWGADSHPKKIAIMLASGTVFVVLGSIGASVSALYGVDGTLGIICGLCLAVVGATFLNVAADSHIVRTVALSLSARVNSQKRIAAFVGIFTGQVLFTVLVGINLAEFTKWAVYFALAGILTGGIFAVIMLINRSWRWLPDVSNCPPTQQAQMKEPQKHVTRIPSLKVMIILLVISFLYNLPEGFVETTFENFIVDSYSANALIVYSFIIVFGGILGVFGFWLAGRSKPPSPERDFYWLLPLVIIYYILLSFILPFTVTIGITLGIQIIGSFIQVRFLQSWHRYSHPVKPGLTFQFYVVIFQLGKLCGIGFSGQIMLGVGYEGLFLMAAGILVIPLILVLIFSKITNKIVNKKSTPK
ncbi:MAG: hypothetical protein RBG13Loki_3322 [Promethearchaeota archaeon CR_4]|nr:MAG: hypothetical protein RBG13Loki_3322 [Candidatus Lokiarchaeota archaeon CR_4]